MNDMVSGVAGRIFQQIAENQASAQQAKSPAGRSFESFLQQQDGVAKTETQADKPSAPTLTDEQRREVIDALQSDLAARTGNAPNSSANFNDMMKTLVENKSRLGFLNDMYASVGKTSKATNDIGGRLIQVEDEYKAVESIMKSNKNLSTGELLALQAQLYQVGQHIEVMSKVVDQMAGGIKTVLNTNV